MDLKRPKRTSKYSEHFDQINASPELVAKAIMNSPPRKSKEWKYKNKGIEATNHSR